MHLGKQESSSVSDKKKKYVDELVDILLREEDELDRNGDSTDKPVSIKTCLESQYLGQHLEFESE